MSVATKGKARSKEEDEIMKEDSREKIISKMVDAALKEKYSGLYRKYDHKIVFEVWNATVNNSRRSGHDKWSSEMTIQEALDSLDDLFDPVESLIQEKESPWDRNKK